MSRRYPAQILLATAFLDITKAALTGTLNSATSGYCTKRYQELLVTSLTACHLADTTAPLRLLDHLAAFALSAFPCHGVAPYPKFVLRALERELTQRSVAHPHEAAREILPGIDDAYA